MCGSYSLLGIIACGFICLVCIIGLDRRKRFLCSSTLPDQFWDPPRALYAAVKRLGRGIEHSAVFSVEGKPEWSCASTSAGTFTFTIIV